jgi:hypothetical protein
MGLVQLRPFVAGDHAQSACATKLTFGAAATHHRGCATDFRRVTGSTWAVLARPDRTARRGEDESSATQLRALIGLTNSTGLLERICSPDARECQREAHCVSANSTTSVSGNGSYRSCHRRRGRARPCNRLRHRSRHRARSSSRKFDATRTVENAGGCRRTPDEKLRQRVRRSCSARSVAEKNSVFVDDPQFKKLRGPPRVDGHPLEKLRVNALRRDLARLFDAARRPDAERLDAARSSDEERALSGR